MFHLSNVLNVKSIIIGTKMVTEGFMKLNFEDEEKLGREREEKWASFTYKISKATQIRITVTCGKEEHCYLMVIFKMVTTL